MLVICNLPPFDISVPPHGIATIVGFLKSQGIHLEICDINIDIFHKISNTNKQLWNLDKFNYWNDYYLYYNEIHDHISKNLSSQLISLILKKVRIIGFFVHSANVHVVIFAIKFLKKIQPKIKIFIGGPAVNSELFYNLRDVVDSAIYGEGEWAVYYLYNYWINNITPDPITMYHCHYEYISNDQVVTRIGKKQNKTIDFFPEWNCYDLNKYTLPYIPIEISKGCIANCTFCSEQKKAFALKVKHRSIVLQEIKHILNYGVKYIIFTDLLLNFDHNYLADLMDDIIQENFNITWECLCRIDKRLSMKLLDKMYQAGCRTITFGVESGSEKILQYMNKKITVAEIISCIYRCYKQNIIVKVEILIGHPAESWIDLLKTMILIFKLKKYISTVEIGSPLVIEQDCTLYKQQKEFGIINYHPVRWRTKYYTSTYILRRFRIYVVYHYTKLLRLEANVDTLKA